MYVCCVSSGIFHCFKYRTTLRQMVGHLVMCSLFIHSFWNDKKKIKYCWRISSPLRCRFRLLPRTDLCIFAIRCCLWNFIRKEYAENVCQILNDIYSIVHSKKWEFYRRIITKQFSPFSSQGQSTVVVGLPTISNILRYKRAQLCTSNANCQLHR